MGIVFLGRWIALLPIMAIMPIGFRALGVAVGPARGSDGRDMGNRGGGSDPVHVTHLDASGPMSLIVRTRSSRGCRGDCRGDCAMTLNSVYKDCIGDSGNCLNANAFSEWNEARARPEAF